MGGRPIELVAGQELILVADENDQVEGDATRLGCNYAHLATSVAPGARILIEDGGLTLVVVECRDRHVITRVENSYVLDERKNMNLPGTERAV